jgi:hypothetical protein
MNCYHQARLCTRRGEDRAFISSADSPKTLVTFSGSRFGPYRFSSFLSRVSNSFFMGPHLCSSARDRWSNSVVSNARRWRSMISANDKPSWALAWPEATARSTAESSFGKSAGVRIRGNRKRLFGGLAFATNPSLAITPRRRVACDFFVVVTARFRIRSDGTGPTQNSAL